MNLIDISTLIDPTLACPSCGCDSERLTWHADTDAYVCDSCLTHNPATCDDAWCGWDTCHGMR